MDDNRFFRSVRRVNAIAILLILLFVIGFGAYSLIAEIFRSRSPVVITNIAEDPAGEEKWSLGSSREIAGTEFIYIPLESEKKNISAPAPSLAKSNLRFYDRSYFSPSRNLLFVNRQTREMKWLFKNNDQLIVDIDHLTAQARYDKDGIIDAILYKIIKKDTNKDGLLSSDDITDIAISHPDGSHYKEILQTVERIFGTVDINGNELLILYQSKGKGYASTVLLNDMSVKGTDEMPKIVLP